ncbi:hypothetical protein GA0061098_10535 [Bradyrhizobium shewense]|uniref:Uncharacterized protein n=1 Tax=Bradyrhizobium shewense TaxID=1761772 RepID=A0A1C3XU41_9BRAD|nr:hypothetical protein GA0061098_10535 [Bradyrhizobium shewense]
MTGGSSWTSLSWPTPHRDILLRIASHAHQPKRAARQIGQAIGTEYPVSSEKRLRFMLWSLSWARANFNLD